MPASPVRHETRALLRAHLSAATRYRHLTRHCPICHQLQRLAMELPPRPLTASEGPEGPSREAGEPEPSPRPSRPAEPERMV